MKQGEGVNQEGGDAVVGFAEDARDLPVDAAAHVGGLGILHENGADLVAHAALRHHVPRLSRRLLEVAARPRRNLRSQNSNSTSNLKGIRRWPVSGLARAVLSVLHLSQLEGSAPRPSLK